MKFLILTLSLLPLLASCEMDSDFYEPLPPGVQVERNNLHQHESRSSAYYRAPVQSYVEERNGFVRPSNARPVLRAEAAPNMHQHPAAPVVRRAEVQGNRHGHPATPGVRIETAKNTHGHPGQAGSAVVVRKKPTIQPQVEVEVQKNVHGHD